jgi:hypothetical protein
MNSESNMKSILQIKKLLTMIKRLYKMLDGS